MKIIISPAKSLDFDSELNTKNFSNPKFLEKTLAINSILKKKSPSDLMKLQSISEKLSELNWKRNLEFSENQNDDLLVSENEHKKICVMFLEKNRDELFKKN